MKLLLWIGLLLVVLGGVTFFFGAGSNADINRVIPMTATIICLVAGLGLVTVGAVAREH